MIRRPPRSTHCISSAASDVYKRQYQRRVHGLHVDRQYRPLLVAVDLHPRPGAGLGGQSLGTRHPGRGHKKQKAKKRQECMGQKFETTRQGIKEEKNGSSVLKIEDRNRLNMEQQKKIDKGYKIKIEKE
eukprot:TRINITY_DN4176_c0_g1_i4.p2 TRINITY_DN4176_c0_g1~~TRINITY_DN4176_c0_g1_i4.p2  ORF type:complete len:129 (+),score=30.38 TRINITY_DN4176_c0_g1_i4:114-500(+)